MMKFCFSICISVEIKRFKKSPVDFEVAAQCWLSYEIHKESVMSIRKGFKNIFYLLKIHLWNGCFIFKENKEKNERNKREGACEGGQLVYSSHMGEVALNLRAKWVCWQMLTANHGLDSLLKTSLYACTSSTVELVHYMKTTTALLFFLLL